MLKSYIIWRVQKMRNQVAKILKTIAIICWILMVLGSGIRAFIQSYLTNGVLWYWSLLTIILGGFIGGFLVALVPYAFGEVIELLQDIKDNTRYLEDIKNNVGNSSATTSQTSSQTNYAPAAPILDESIPKL
jgi:hypothetical protein